MNKLFDLLQQPAYFVFGAGASKAYGFPLWEELKTGLLHHLDSDIDRSTSNARVEICKKMEIPDNR